MPHLTAVGTRGAIDHRVVGFRRALCGPVIEYFKAKDVQIRKGCRSWPTLSYPRDFHPPIKSFLCRLKKGLVKRAANLANVARVAEDHGQIIEIDFAQIANVIFHRPSVVQLGDKPKILANNSLKEPLLATPAIAEGAIYLRTDKHLYCIAAKK